MKISGALGYIPCYEGAISECGVSYCQTLLLRNKSTLAVQTTDLYEREENLQGAF